MSFYGLTGILHIGQTGYLISDGQGQINPNSTIEIQAKTNGTVGIGDQNGNENGNNGDQMELVLQGSMQENNVTSRSCAWWAAMRTTPRRRETPPIPGSPIACW